MATSKPLIASLFLSLLLLLHLVEADMMVNTDAALGYSSPKIDCGGACTARCRLSSRPRLCKRACGTCCARCNCVPPGTAGNYEVCPCYASLTTHGGRRKCP
ncbi:hypothetical protein Patl1_09548 [Pistacia atlantica]|uniref:Uncharacterized protein n=1 Tax=Pistacia atlantica TaxID=434234 RepID=A0ACC1AIC3_9ROSI|nr:hypothetical protein Patl1_09548 [Pistacia atlantica]